ncbi:hypothetical protein PLESTB_000117000 [Pleodorina starrii]|uniref:phytol kinase n=1 Tax=Pleodorina starrii TaxID=330485 RepID=A0A9W6EXE8_9CHLO|nr:hypothetical protein PLESTB_000117000 [Pleodorina starrii]GLC71934.1 hypothetical protein PLESTF_001182700 [Pleodorina starrii]
MPVGGAASRRPLDGLLRRTRALCTDELQNLPDDGATGPTLVKRIRVAAEDLMELLSHKDLDGIQSAWELIGKNQLAGLFALFGIAVRRSAATASASSAEREAFWSMRAALNAHLRRLLVAHVEGKVWGILSNSIAEALLGSPAIRCYALLLADIASQLGPPSLEPCSPCHAITSATTVVEEVVTLLEFLTLHKPFARIDGVLELEVMNSFLLEHWARALLLASRCESARDEAGRLLPRLGRALRSINYTSGMIERNHSLSYLLTGHLVGLAAALDGGTTYNMPTAGPGTSVAPLADDRGRRLLFQSHTFVDTDFARWALSQWTSNIAGMARHLQPGSLWFTCSIRELVARRQRYLRQQAQELEMQRTKGFPFIASRLAQASLLNSLSTSTCLSVPPFKVAATLDVSMRLASSAVEALAGAGQQQQQQQPSSSGAVAAAAATQQQQQQRPRVPPAEAAPFGLQALKCARAAGWDLGWAPEAEHPPRKLEQLQRWWDLTARFVRAAAEPHPEWFVDGSWTRECVSELLALRVQANTAAASPVSAAESVASCPSADVPVALRAGYLQLLELLLRRPASTEKHTRKSFDNPLAGASADGWAQALTFADPRVTASLMATVAKLARRATLQLGAAAAAARAEYVAAGIACPDVFHPPGGLYSPNIPNQPRLHEAIGGLRDALNHADSVQRFAYEALAPSRDSVSIIDRLRSAVAEAARRPSAGDPLGPQAQRRSRCGRGGSRAEVAAEGSCGGEGGGSGGGAAPGSGDRGLDAGAGASGGSSGVKGALGDGAVIPIAVGEASEGPGSRGGGEEDETGSGQRRANGDVDPKHPALQRLAAALSQVAVRVLPETTRLVADLEGSFARNRVTYLLQRIVAWVPILAAAAATPGAPASSPAAATATTETRAGPVGGSDEPSAGLQAPQQQPAAGSAAATVAPAAMASAARGDGPAHISHSAAAECGVAPAPRTAAASVAAEWDRFLWVEFGLPRLLALASRSISALLPKFDNLVADLEKVLAGALRALVHWAPERLARALATRGSAAVASAGGSRTDGTMSGAAAAACRPGCRLLDMERLRDVLGPEGKLRDPELLAALERLVAAAEESAEVGTGAASGRGGTAAAAAAAAEQPRPLPEELRQWAAAAALLVPPSEVRAVLPACDYPGCVNLDGDSEAGLGLAGCAGCGGRVRYCSRDCQTAHWKAGHKAACMRG